MRAAPLVLLLLGGCAASQSVVLLPGEAGHPVGAVAVIDEAGADRAVIATADTRASLGSGTIRARALPARQVDRRYGMLVADLPPPPIAFTLGFDVAVARLAEDQEETLQALLRAAAERPGAEVQVVGHTDTLDTDAVNDRLSRRRAEEVRLYLIRRGLTPDQVRATWRGERQPLELTGDGVANATNRRVEVIVR